MKKFGVLKWILFFYRNEIEHRLEVWTQNRISRSTLITSNQLNERKIRRKICRKLKIFFVLLVPIRNVQNNTEFCWSILETWRRKSNWIRLFERVLKSRSMISTTQTNRSEKEPKATRNGEREREKKKTIYVNSSDIYGKINNDR